MRDPEERRFRQLIRRGQLDRARALAWVWVQASHPASHRYRTWKTRLDQLQ